MRHKTLQCKCSEDIKELIHKYYFEPLRIKVRQEIVSKTEYNKQWVQLSEMAAAQWDQILKNKKNKEIFKKYGYLNITYKQGKCVRVPFSKGRPKVENKAKHRVTVRLKDEEYQRLEDICLTGNINASDVMRMALQQYLKDKTVKQVAFDLTYLK